MAPAAPRHEPVRICSSRTPRVSVYPFEIKTRPTPHMPRPKRKTEATTLKMTPEVRQLWEKCAEREHRSLTNMFEVMVRDYAARQSDPVQPSPPASNNKI